MAENETRKIKLVQAAPKRADENPTIVKDGIYIYEGVKMKASFIENGYHPNRVVVHLENIE